MEAITKIALLFTLFWLCSTRMVLGYFSTTISARGAIQAADAWTQPQSWLTIEHQQFQSQPDEKITNGSFQSELDGWNVDGDVQVIHGSDQYVTAPQGSSEHMVRLGGPQSTGSVLTNTITRHIPAGVQSLQFSYSIYSQQRIETGDPGLMVFANDHLIFQKWGSDVDSATQSSGWQTAVIDLSSIQSDTTLTLAFYAGQSIVPNFDPTPHATWAYFTEFSTASVLADAQTVFHIHVSDGAAPLAMIDYRVFEDSTFQLDHQPQQPIHYWAADQNRSESPHQLSVRFVGPLSATISDLQVEQVKENQFLLTWLSPAEVSYQIRYSLDPITESTPWSSLLPVSITTEDGLPGSGLRASKPIGQQERYLVRVSQPAAQYYFAVQPSAIAGDNFPRSNIAQISLDHVPTISYSEDIILSAVASHGQWLEVFNTGDLPIQMDGWRLRLEPTGQEIALPTQLVLPHRAMVISFSSANTLPLTADIFGLELWQDQTKIDSLEYGYQPTAEAYGHMPDVVGPVIPILSTPGRKHAATVADLRPSAMLSRDGDTVQLHLYDAVGFETAHYQIEYDHANGHDGIEGELAPQHLEEQTQQLYLGTCSAQSCLPHQDIKNLHYTITLTSSLRPTYQLVGS